MWNFYPQEKAGGVDLTMYFSWEGEWIPGERGIGRGGEEKSVQRRQLSICSPVDGHFHYFQGLCQKQSHN